MHCHNRWLFSVSVPIVSLHEFFVVYFVYMKNKNAFGVLLLVAVVAGSGVFIGNNLTNVTDNQAAAVVAVDTSAITPTTAVTATLGSPVMAPCTINSFTVPANTKLSATTLAAAIKTTNCTNVYAVINSGLYYQKYEALPKSGPYTFTTKAFVPIPSAPTFSMADKTLDVTLFAGSAKNIASVTKSVPFSDITNPSSNQCAFTLAATPTIVTKGQKVTLKWANTSSKCSVTVAKADALGTITTLSTSNASTGSTTDIVNGSASYYVSSGAGSASAFNTVLTAKAVDVLVK